MANFSSITPSLGKILKHFHAARLLTDTEQQHIVRGKGAAVMTRWQWLTAGAVSMAAAGSVATTSGMVLLSAALCG